MCYLHVHAQPTSGQTLKKNDSTSPSPPHMVYVWCWGIEARP